VGTFAKTSLLAVAACAGCTLVTSLDGFSGGVDHPDAAVGVIDSSVDATIPQPDADASEAGPTNAYANAVMADAPLAYLRLDETSGTTAKDASGHGHDAIVRGSVVWGVTGIVPGGAVRLDGSTSALDFGDTFDFAGRSPFTLEAWVLEDASDTTFRHIFTKDIAPASGREEYGVFFYKGQIQMERYVAGDQVVAGNLAPGIVGRWAHVVGTYDGDTMAIYVDGAKTDSAADSRSQASKATPFYSGARAIGEGVTNGSLDEIAIYDKALSPERVKAHYDAR
jgi:hypothetical protein